MFSMRLHRSFLGSTERAVPETRREHMIRREELIARIKDEEEQLAALQSDIVERHGAIEPAHESRRIGPSRRSRV
jgi:hypothetical protein